MRIRLSHFLFFLLFFNPLFLSAQVTFTIGVTGYPKEETSGRFSSLERWARLAAAVEEWRKEKTPQKVLLLDTGDVFARFEEDTPEVSIQEKLFSRLNYDAVVLGAMDFRWGRERLVVSRRRHGMPWISANVVMGKTSQNFMRPYVLRYPGVRVGVIGFTRADVRDRVGRSPVQGLLFNDPSLVAKGLHSILKKDADIFIALVNLPPGGSLKLAKADPYLHVIVGAPDPSQKEGVVLSPQGPLLVTALDEEDSIGRLEVTFRGSRKKGFYLTDFRYEKVRLNAFEPDERLLKWGFSQIPSSTESENPEKESRPLQDDEEAF